MSGVSDAEVVHVECRLLPGFAGMLTQCLLMSVAVFSLVVKKFAEDKAIGVHARIRKRSWEEFLLDSSKQIWGSLWLHILNLVFAVRLHRKTAIGDSCDWYWVNIVIDCTLGTAIEYTLFKALTRYVVPFLFSPAEAAEFESGRYSGTSSPTATLRNIQWRCYWKQLSLWLLVCTSMKLTVYVIMKAYREPFVETADWVLARWSERPEGKLLIVMVITPLVMNTLQLWIIDNFLKRRDTTMFKPTTTTQQQQPFLP